MARKKAPSNQGAVWTTKDFAAIRLRTRGSWVRFLPGAPIFKGLFRSHR